MHTSEQKQKRQNFYAHKKHLRGRKSLVWRFVLFTLFTLFVLFTLFILFVLFMLFGRFVLSASVKSSCKKKIIKRFNIALITSFILLLKWLPQGKNQSPPVQGSCQPGRTTSKPLSQIHQQQR